MPLVCTHAHCLPVYYSSQRVRLATSSYLPPPSLPDHSPFLFKSFVNFIVSLFKHFFLFLLLSLLFPPPLGVTGVWTTGAMPPVLSPPNCGCLPMHLRGRGFGCGHSLTTTYHVFQSVTWQVVRLSIRDCIASNPHGSRHKY